VPIWLGETRENTDERISEMVTLAEKNDIGWSFWPYKKMDSTCGVVSFSPPVYWDEICKLAEVPGGFNSENWRKARFALAPGHSRAALNDLLEKIQLQNCRFDDNYLRALHLKQ
jgi:hypothetical protein